MLALLFALVAACVLAIIIRRCRIVGLTGGIGCGKSSAAGAIRALGHTVIDVDALAHQVTEPGTLAHLLIAYSFGPSVQQVCECYRACSLAFFQHPILHQPSGAIDRAKLRDLVFRDRAARKKLTSIVHPFVIVELIRRILSHCVVRREPFIVVGQMFSLSQYKIALPPHR